MRKAFFGLCMLSAISGLAQTTSSTTAVDIEKATGRLSPRDFYAIGGMPMSSTKYIKIASGTPYLTEYFLKGAVATSDSSGYGNVRIKLDLLENSISYKNDQGQEMICTTPLVVLNLRDSVTNKQYYFVLGSSIPGAEAKVWYQVLTSGNITLYKQYYKDIAETKPYGSSVTEQTIRTSERYFIATNGAFERVKKPKDIAENVSKKTKELADYIDKQKLSGKKESDYIAAVEYYNSL